MRKNFQTLSIIWKAKNKLEKWFHVLQLEMCRLNYMAKCFQRASDDAISTVVYFLSAITDHHANLFLMLCRKHIPLQVIARLNQIFRFCCNTISIVAINKNRKTQHHKYRHWYHIHRANIVIFVQILEIK